MRSLRKHLSSLLALWLSCQVVALAAPAVLLAAGSVPVEELCTCPDGDHDTCPMHHERPDSSQASTADCAMTSACAPASMALLSMAGGNGVLPSPVVFARPDTGSDIVIRPLAIADGPVALDTPPPRY